MKSIQEIIRELEKSPNNVKYTRLCEICDYYFGEARQKRTSHKVYKMPWAGDPRVNLQNNHGGVRAYQVRQVIQALKLLRVKQEHNESNR